MDLRDATPSDVDAIREVARASLRESYGEMLDAALIDEAVERWYGVDDVDERITDDDTVFVVAADGDDLLGFAESYVVEGRDPVGEIDWVQVHPDHRGRGLGSRLLSRVETELLDRGVARIEGRVLVENEAGGAFYEGEGFDPAGGHRIEIGDQAFTERLYLRFPDETDQQVLVEARQTDDDERVYVAYDETQRGSLGPFYATYADREHAERYGYACGNCESLDTAVGTMDEVECNSCGNRRKPARWDAAYL